jgi:hypothetical protein
MGVMYSEERFGQGSLLISTKYFQNRIVIFGLEKYRAMSPRPEVPSQKYRRLANKTQIMIEINNALFNSDTRADNIVNLKETSGTRIRDKPGGIR